MRFRLIGLVLLAGCGGGSDPVTPPPPPPPPPGPAPVFSISLSRDTATLVPRQALQFIAVTRDQSGNTLSGRAVVWTSAAGTIATVTGDGVVTAIAAGISTITATSEGKTGSASVTVRDGAVVTSAGGLAATADSVARVTLPAGAVATDQAITIAPVANPFPHPRLITGTAFDFGPTGTFLQPVTIKIGFAGTTVPATADPARLRLHRLTGGAWVELTGSTVDVTAKTVTGQTSSFSTYAVIELAPLPVATITLARDTATLVPLQSLQLGAVLKEQGGAVLTGRAVAWTSSAASVASVSAAGIVTALSAGTATITASSEGKSGTATITVKDGAQMGVSGGVVSTANGVAKVAFPAGAVASSQTITIEPVLNPVANPLLVAGTAFEFGPSGSFGQPVTMTISYAGSTVPAATVPGTLTLHRLTNGAWVPLPGSTVDVNAKTVTAQTSSFSTYAILGSAPAQQVILTYNAGVGAGCSLPATDPLCGFLANPGYWTVPQDVYIATFELWGGAGGGFAGIGAGGKGGKTTATIAVFPGEVILVGLGSAGGFVSTPGGGGHGGSGRAVTTVSINGAQPGSGGFCTFVPPNNDYFQPCGGFNGNGGAGGGATTVQRGSFGPKIIVAGGGGGDGASRTVPVGAGPVTGWVLVPGVAGGLGGGLVGGDGAPGNGSQIQSAPGGGSGGSQLSGGQGGAPSVGINQGGHAQAPGENGTAQFGGGAGGSSSATGGGGGGGGWFGGGGGGPTFVACCDLGGTVDRSTGGGGGGGSSFGPAGSVFFQGVNAGGGKAVITYTPSPGLAPTVVAIASSLPNPSRPNQPITFTATVSPKPPATGVVTGTVQFEINGVVVGGGPIPLVNGQADTGPLNLPLGNQAVRVVFLGTSTHAPGAANLLRTILP